MRLFLTILFLLALTPGTASAALEPWYEEVYAEVRKHYGAEAEARFRKLYAFVEENYELDEIDKARKVNYLANNLTWIADQDHYHQNDYWATPLETISSFGGDCEDIAITKWALLRAMNVAPEKLRLAHVELRRTGQAHMVLAFDPNPSDTSPSKPVYVLDNIAPEMLDHRRRTDLKLIYTVDGERNVRIFSDDGRHRRVVKSVEHAKVKKMIEIADRMAKQRAQIRELNGGRPLF